MTREASEEFPILDQEDVRGALPVENSDHLDDDDDVYRRINELFEAVGVR